MYIERHVIWDNNNGLRSTKLWLGTGSPLISRHVYNFARNMVDGKVDFWRAMTHLFSMFGIANVWKTGGKYTIVVRKMRAPILVPWRHG